VAARFGYRLRRLIAHEPQDLSPFVADLHRWWYRRRGMPAQRLLVESYVHWEPMWALHLGAVPFWMRFDMETDHDELRAYLKETQPYAHIHLFSQAVSPGVVPVQRWRELAASAATTHGEVIGVDENAYPLDTGSSMRYQPAFAALPPRHPLPAPLTMTDIDHFLDTATVSYRITWS
jgi:hypothetical protein